MRRFIPRGLAAGSPTPCPFGMPRSLRSGEVYLQLFFSSPGAHHLPPAAVSFQKFSMYCVPETMPSTIAIHMAAIPTS